MCCNTCNFCNSFLNSCGCGVATCGYNTSRSGGFQQICRDCNGNIWVRVTNENSCGCHTCQRCRFYDNNGCGATASTNYGTRCGSVTNFGNGSGCSRGCGGSVYSCVDGDAFFARQYGLTNTGRSSCGCLS